MDILFKILVTIALLILGSAFVMKWCGKTENIADGVKKIINDIIEDLTGKTTTNETAYLYPVPVSLYQSEALEEKLHIFFQYFMVTNCYYPTDNVFSIVFMAFNPKQDLKTLEQIINAIFAKWIFNVQNLSANTILDVYIHFENGYLYINYALNHNGSNEINLQLSNKKSRKIKEIIELTINEDLLE